MTSIYLPSGYWWSVWAWQEPTLSPDPEFQVAWWNCGVQLVRVIVVFSHHAWLVQPKSFMWFGDGRRKIGRHGMLNDHMVNVG